MMRTTWNGSVYHYSGTRTTVWQPLVYRIKSRQLNIFIGIIESFEGFIYIILFIHYYITTVEHLLIREMTIYYF